VDLLPRLIGSAFVRLGCQKKGFAVSGDPGSQAPFRIAVAGRGIHVIDTVTQCKLQRGVRLSLSDLTKRCGTE